jgi:hypothetical protein
VGWSLAFHTLKKPILRDVGISVSAFAVVLPQERQRFSWERKKILSLKQKSTSKILKKMAGGIERMWEGKEMRMKPVKCPLELNIVTRQSPSPGTASTGNTSIYHLV